jgi:hypothetical protein
MTTITNIQVQIINARKEFKELADTTPNSNQTFFAMCQAVEKLLSNHHLEFIKAHEIVRDNFKAGRDLVSYDA